MGKQETEKDKPWSCILFRILRSLSEAARERVESSTTQTALLTAASFRT